MTEEFNIGILLDAQETLNEKYVPGWRNEINMEQYLTATLTEVAEFFESAPRSGGVQTTGTPGWKWWKKVLSDDEQNKKIEIIDVLHFVLGTWMLIGSKEEIIKAVQDYQFFDFGGSNLMGFHKSYSSFTIYSIDGELESSILSGMNLMEYMMKETDMTWKGLEEGYFLKNKLNHSRIEGGYSEGTYSKHDENGQEDNRKLEV